MEKALVIVDKITPTGPVASHPLQYKPKKPKCGNFSLLKKMPADHVLPRSIFPLSFRATPFLSSKGMSGSARTLLYPKKGRKINTGDSRKTVIHLPMLLKAKLQGIVCFSWVGTAFCVSKSSPSNLLTAISRFFKLFPVPENTSGVLLNNT